MSKNRPNWLSHLEEWENSEYDGIKGQPPKWVPQPYKKKFLSARNALLLTMYENNVGYKEMKSHFDKMVTEKYYLLSRALMYEKSIYDESLLILMDLYKAVLVGEDKGLVILVGNEAAKGRKFSSAGSSKKGKVYEPKKSIIKICEEIGSTKPDDVLNALRDVDLCEDLYRSTKKPIGASFAVFDDEKIINYIPRGKAPNNQKQITFSRLKNILSEIKKQ